MLATTQDAPRPGTSDLSAESHLLFSLTFAVCVVIPHSLQAVTAALMAATAATCLFTLRSSSRIGYLGICYILGVVVTCVYVVVGMVRSAPSEAVYQTIAIYIVSPMLWMIMLRTMLQRNGAVWITGYLVKLAWLCCASVALFFYLYLNFGKTAVTFFIEEANINIRGGFSGATMHVYGSLIFLTAALFAAPEVVANKLNRVLLLLALVVSALTSGRAALIVAVPVGLLVGFFVRRVEHRDGGLVQAARGSWLRYLLIFLTVVGAVALLDALVEDIDLSVIIDALLDKIERGGGEARIDQSAALLSGTLDYSGLGAGHGIGASVQRSDYAWRYENVPLAVLFKVGVIGSAIYVLPFVIYVARVVGRILTGTLGSIDKFMFAGFVGVFLAASTNPYLESFIFQWMFILPLVALGIEPRPPAEARTWPGWPQSEAR